MGHTYWHRHKSQLKWVIHIYIVASHNWNESFPPSQITTEKSHFHHHKSQLKWVILITPYQDHNWTRQDNNKIQHINTRTKLIKYQTVTYTWKKYNNITGWQGEDMRAERQVKWVMNNNRIQHIHASAKLIKINIKLSSSHGQKFPKITG